MAIVMKRAGKDSQTNSSKTSKGDEINWVGDGGGTVKV
jgi:hypothetical protein